jgi:hypothetical protein
MKRLFLFVVFLIAGCQSINVTVNSGGTPCDVWISDSNNKEVVVPTDMLRNANLQAPMQGGTTQGDQVQGK